VFDCNQEDKKLVEAYMEENLYNLEKIAGFDFALQRLLEKIFRCLKKKSTSSYLRYKAKRAVFLV